MEYKLNRYKLIFPDGSIKITWAGSKTAAINKAVKAGLFNVSECEFAPLPADPGDLSFLDDIKKGEN